MNDQAAAVPFISKNGIRGTAKMPSALAADDLQREVRFETGRRAMVNAKYLLPKQDGSYFLDLNVDPRPPEPAQVEAVADAPTGIEDVDAIIPVTEEQLTVSRHVRETGRVRVTKTVTEVPHDYDALIAYEDYTVERVPVNREAAAVEKPRVEGDVVIIPVYEEEAVVTRRLILREEIHLTKRRREEHRPGSISLRKHAVRIERTPAQE